MHFTVFVVGQRILLQQVHHHFIGNHQVFVGGRCLSNQLQDVEQFACVASAVAQHGTRFLQFNMALAQLSVFGESTVQQSEQVVAFQRFEHIELAA